MVIILECTKISNHYIVHLKLIQYCKIIILQKRSVGAGNVQLAVFNRVISVCLVENMPFDKRLKDKGMHYGDIWEKNVPDQMNSLAKVLRQSVPGCQ